MPRRSLTVMMVLSLWLFAFRASAQDAAPAPLPGRLSISSIPRTEPPPTIQDYLDAAAMANAAGATGSIMTYHWSELEPEPHTFDLESFQGSLGYQRSQYAYDSLVGVQLINTTRRETPPDLADLPFDAPAFLDRFKALFDAMLPRLDTDVVYFSIGNEVDIYFDLHPEEIGAYAAFFTAARDYIHTRAPWLLVGVTLTFDGLTSRAGEMAPLIDASDVLIATYYPLALGGEPNPAAPLRDIPILLEATGERPLVIQEIGYPASELLGSSERDQAAFVHNVFQAWREAGPRIPFLNYFLLHDIPASLCTELTAYYGLPDNRVFYEFLCTLGLRKADGTPRLAWQAFVEEAGGQAMDTAARS